MQYLLLTLGVLVVLVVLYLVARRIKPFGQALAFVCTVISRVNIKVAEFMNNVADSCQRIGLASLHFPPGSADRDYWNGIDVLSRLVFFVLAVLILAGETVNTLLVLPALFQTANHVSLPGIVDIASAALFICCPALFGAVIWECWGKIPVGAGLFPSMGKLSRWVLGIIAGLFLLLTILVSGYFYLFRAVFLADPQSAQAMVPYILAGLGIEVAAVAPFALVALVVGGAGVVSVLLFGMAQGCRVSARSALLWPSLLDTLAVHLSQGTLSVHGEYVGHNPYKVPALPFSPGQSVTALLHEYASMGDAEIREGQPIETTGMEVPMKDIENASIVTVGGLGTRLFPHFKEKIGELYATRNFRSVGHIDVDNTSVDTAIPGFVDLSPTPAKRQRVVLHEVSRGQATKKLFDDTIENLVETLLPAKASPAPLIFIIDCHHLVDCVEGIESLARRLPYHGIVVVTEVSTRDLQEKTVQVGIADIQALAIEDCIQTTILTDRHSPFATQYGLDTQHKFLAHTLVGLVVAHKHSHQNRSFVNVLDDLHKLAPFTAISFASERVVTGSMPKRLSWLHLPAGSAGTGNYGDILSQTRTGIDRCVTEEDTATFQSVLSPDTERVIFSSVPIRLDDERFAACVRDDSLYVEKHYPFATSITVRGNGCAYPHHLGSRFLVTAACLYPLAPVTLQRMYEGKQVKVTPLFPVTTTLEVPSSNGHVSTTDHTNKTKATKVSTTRQKKVAPVKRDGRKNAKTTAN
jgi:hypothetical protein